MSDDWTTQDRANFRETQASNRREKRTRRYLWIFVALALLGGGGSLLSVLRLRAISSQAAHWKTEAAARDNDLDATKAVIAALNADLDTAAKELKALQAAYEEQGAAYAGELAELARLRDALADAGFDSVEQMEDHLHTHEGQLSDVARWYGWCRRDYIACTCELGERRNCDPTKVDFGGVIHTQ